ncbi:hypothetical protein TNCV_352291 [Trichonephila clavipes]|nr:hypothetical protein TNCV_352291 [Trichonephila clavipes]
MSSRSAFYNQYNKYASDRICCPKCHESMTIKQFYHQHASEKHGLNVRKQCVFCFGHRYWNYGQKNRPDNIIHIISCLQRFAKDAKDLWAFLDEEDEEMVEETEEAEIEMCECQHFQPNPHDMYGRPKLNNVGFMTWVLRNPTCGKRE